VEERLGAAIDDELSLTMGQPPSETD
jgi:hypothetical protein